VDQTINKNFSSPIEVEEIVWAKAHIQKHTKDAAIGIDQFANKDIVAKW
jgi:hypothetical protein